MPGPLLPDDARSARAARPQPRPGPPVDPDAPTVRPVLRAAPDPVPDGPALRPRAVADPGAPVPRPVDPVVPPQPGPRAAAGDDLALQLPAWDLVPPAEFVVRQRRRR